MPRRRVGRRRDQRAWLDNVILRARLVQAARDAYPDFSYRRQQQGNRGVIYSFSATVPLEGFDPRHVTILFNQLYPTIPSCWQTVPTTRRTATPTAPTGAGSVCGFRATHPNASGSPKTGCYISSA